MVNIFNNRFFNILFVGSDEEEYALLEDAVRSLNSMSVNFSIARQERNLLFKAPKGIDLTFYCQDGADLESIHTPVFMNPTAVITSSLKKDITSATYKNGATYVLHKPIKQVEILTVLNNSFSLSEKYLKTNTKDKYVLSFLENIINKEITVINPVFSPFKPKGYSYPDIDRVSDELESVESYLDMLAEKGFFAKKLNNRFRLCKQCGTHHINYREVCPACSSLDIEKKQMIHHFHCGHIDSFESYMKGTDLICPKCEQTLRHIGLDYEKPSEYYKCSSCQVIVAEPKVEPECLVCGITCETHETIEKHIFSYEITELAYEAVKNGVISGVDLASILFDNHTKLYNKQYFEIELKRELIRMTRYESDFTLILARIEKVEEVQLNHPDKIVWYVNTIFKALCKYLRDLDTTCVWESNTLGILLTETNYEEAMFVAKRISSNIGSLEYLYDIAKPEITFSIIQGDSSFETSGQLITLALEELSDE